MKKVVFVIMHLQDAGERRLLQIEDLEGEKTDELFTCAKDYDAKRRNRLV